MSDRVLQILLRLFAMIALEDGVTAEERDIVRRFLEEHLASAEVAAQMERFEAAIAARSDTDAGQVAREADASLSRKQQAILLMHLYDLILADGQISPGEEAHLASVAAALSLPPGWVDAIRAFASARSADELPAHSPNLQSAEGFLLLGHALSPKEGQRHIQAYLDQPIAVLALGEGLIYLLKYFGDEYLQLNHQYLPPRHNLVLRHGSVITLPHGHATYFSDIVRAYLPIPAAERLHLSVRGLNFVFPKGNTGLHPLDLEEESGRLVAVMGASGSGKSTLLNILNGNLRPSAGAVLLNGQPLHDDLQAARARIGYVPQDDLLIEDLSVRQNLYFNAKLCHKSMDEKGLHALVDRVLNDLGLSETAELRVGNALDKTISGGQRKRLNIGLELLRTPDIIFFDEPTSGLSSRDSENIMDLLKELTFKGKLIFVVIHQPSSEIFRMFDSLLVLDTGGHAVYYGNPLDAVVYFRRASEQVSQRTAACDECGNINAEQIFNILEARVLDENGQPSTKRRSSAAEWGARWREFTGKAGPKPSTSPQGLGPTPSGTPSWLRQFGVFARRDLLAKLGNRQYLAINLLQAPILAIILGVLVRHSEGSGSYAYGANENIPAFFFMSIIVALFTGMTMSAEEIFRDRKIRKREGFLNLSRSGYLLSKTGILFAFMAVQMALYVLVSTLILQLPALWLLYWVVLFSLGCFAIQLGLNVSATFNSAVTIYILIPLLLIPQLILSGTVVRFDRLNPGFTTPRVVPIAADLMASRWAYEGLMVGFQKANSYDAPTFRDASAAGSAVYHKDYWIPEMERVNAWLGRHKAEGGAEYTRRIRLLHQELQAHQRVVPDLVLPCADSLAAAQHSSAIEHCVAQYLRTAKSAHQRAYTQTRARIEATQKALGDKLGGPEALDAFRRAQHNDAIDKLVRNTDSPSKLLEEGEAFVRLHEPIHHHIDGGSPIAYRTHFYAPDKPFLGIRWDTPAFNIAIIWIMSILLHLTLYFDLGRRLIGRWGSAA